MPASIIGELILQPILEFIFHFVCYHIGRAVVGLVTFGKLKCDKILADTPRRKLRWSGLYHKRGAQTYLTAESTALIGMISVVGMIAAGFLFWRFAK
jgi:hypothetical protein